MTLAGKNCAVMPAGKPEAVSVTAALKNKSGVLVRVNVVDDPGETLVEPADDARANLGVGETVTESGATCFADPLLAATVSPLGPIGCTIGFEILRLRSRRRVT